jgi:hypothetical protein
MVDIESPVQPLYGARMALPPDESQPAGLRRRAVADSDDLSAPPRVAPIESKTSDPEPAGPGRFLKPPTDGEIAQIRKLIADTGRPETVAALSWTKPSKDLEHVLYLPEIEIPRALRLGGEMVACAFCSGGHPKTLRPHLLWSADGHLRLVGPTCGPKYFGAAEYREMQRAARAKQLKAANIDVLLEHLGNAHLWREEAVALADFCKGFELLRLAFMERVPTLHQRLRYEVTEHHSALVVYVPLSGDSPDGYRSSTTGEKSAIEPRTVAVLQGAEFLMPGVDARAKAGTIVAAIDQLVAPYKAPLSDDQILDLVDYMSEAALAAAVKNLRAAHDGGRRLFEWLKRARMFLSEANVDALDAWSSHEKNDFNLRVARVSGPPAAVVYRCGVTSVRLPMAEQVVLPTLSHLGSLRV